MCVVGIIEIIVIFDGVGDSGQVEDIDVCCGGIVVLMLDMEIMFVQVSWGVIEIVINIMLFFEVVEFLVYDFLFDSYGGWENCDGVFGEFYFDVEVVMILFDYNEWFILFE